MNKLPTHFTKQLNELSLAWLVELSEAVFKIIENIMLIEMLTEFDATICMSRRWAYSWQGHAFLNF